jgi:hypothetical protein
VEFTKMPLLWRKKEDPSPVTQTRSGPSAKQASQRVMPDAVRPTESQRTPSTLARRSQTVLLSPGP